MYCFHKKVQPTKLQSCLHLFLSNFVLDKLYCCFSVVFQTFLQFLGNNIRDIIEVYKQYQKHVLPLKKKLKKIILTSLISSCEYQINFMTNFESYII